MLPAEKSLAREDRTAGSLIAVNRLDGIAVARTEKTESSVVGRLMLKVARSDVRDASSEAREFESWAIAVAEIAATRKVLNNILMVESEKRGMDWD